MSPRGVCGGRRAIPGLSPDLGGPGQAGEAAAVLARLGTVQAAAGRYADALSSYQRSLALTRELGNHERLGELQDAIVTVQRLARQTEPGPGTK